MFIRYCQKATTLVTTTDIRNYLASYEKAKIGTVGQKLSVLKSFFGWLVKEEILLRDPTSKVKLPKKPKRLPKGLTIEELETIRESCVSLRQRALLEIMYSTGCRLSEISSMNRDDINVQSMNLKVIGKGDKERVVYLSFKALFHLKKYLNSRSDSCEALFVTERQQYRRMGNRAIQREIDKIERAANISKNLTPHIMRHTFATLSMDAGIELADLQHLMGHSNPSTTLVYSQVSEERKQQAFKKYHVQ
jgi:integrase/recombinase XerD